MAVAARGERIEVSAEIGGEFDNGAVQPDAVGTRRSDRVIRAKEDAGQLVPTGRADLDTAAADVVGIDELHPAAHRNLVQDPVGDDERDLRAPWTTPLAAGPYPVTHRSRGRHRQERWSVATA